MNAHRRNKPQLSSLKKVLAVSAVAALAVAGGVVGISAASATGGNSQGYVEIFPACEGAAELSIVAHNLVEGSIVDFSVDGTAADAVVAIPMDKVAFGIRTSGIPVKAGDTYDLTATGPGGYSEHFSGTYDCGVTAPISVTPVAPVVTDEVITCTADYTLKTVSASIAPQATEGIDYSLDGKVVTGPVPVAASGTYLFTAAAKSGYTLTKPLNLYVGVNAGVAPVCEKPVVTPPVDTPPVVAPPVVAPPVVTAPVVAKAKVKVTEAVPNTVQTD